MMDMTQCGPSRNEFTMRHANEPGAQASVRWSRDTLDPSPGATRRSEHAEDPLGPPRSRSPGPSHSASHLPAHRNSQTQLARAEPFASTTSRFLPLVPEPRGESRKAYRPADELIAPGPTSTLWFNRLNQR